MPDFSKNVNLRELVLFSNKLEGEFQLEVQRSESKPDSFILGEIGDFSNNVNLVELDLRGNELTGTSILRATHQNRN